ncbi:hypothetical protein EVAR_47199_1 [Eumeta japonica]|uniref:Uncharacterized protein n=1 Tax=Eumeta variegata TaxID=151549 RepID=A0A4C1XY51_EUMVA|nr:hypothetical protein EVAR_47199_1 [Eumeta japonica]
MFGANGREQSHATLLHGTAVPESRGDPTRRSGRSARRPDINAVAVCAVPSTVIDVHRYQAFCVIKYLFLHLKISTFVFRNSKLQWGPYIISRLTKSLSSLHLQPQT